MILTKLKKTVAALILAVTFIAAAAPTDYLSGKSMGYIYVNLTELIKCPYLQSFIPMFEEELKKEGLSVQDFEGAAALGANCNNIAEMDINLDLAVELKRPVAKKFFNFLSKEMKDAKKVTLYGRPALQDPNGEGQIILFSDYVIAAQFKTSKNGSYSALKTGKNILAENPQLFKHHAFVLFNNSGEFKKMMAEFIKMAPGTVSEKDLAVFKSGYLAVDCYKNGDLRFEVKTVCTSHAAAVEMQKNSKKQMDELSKQLPAEYIALLKRMDTKIVGNSIIQTTVVTKAEMEALIKSFISGIEH